MDEDTTASLLANIAAVLQQQQELMQVLAARPPPERRVEGISMPTYSGALGESLELFLDQARLFFEAKNIDFSHPDNARRVLAMMVSNLKGQAAAWYITQQGNINNIDELADALRLEFIPADLQERLRDALYQLKQRELSDLADYVTRYRQLISRVTDMSELDKITLFTRGLVGPTRAEVVYRRCKTVHAAISVAMEYERSHPHIAQPQRTAAREVPGPTRRVPPADASTPAAEPMEIGQTRFLSRDECRRRNLCFLCKLPGHQMARCPRRSSRRDNRPLRQRPPQRQRFNLIREIEIPPNEHRVIEVFDRMTINAVSMSGEAREHSLMRKAGELNRQAVTILFDSGANHNVIRQGLAPHIVRTKRVLAERFDGSTTPVQEIKEVMADVYFDGYACKNVVFSEWDLPATHDIILGIPWFTRFNPQVD